MNELYMKMLQRMIETMRTQADYLTDLDRQIGDSDHGINMKRGFEAIEAQLDVIQTKSVGDALNQCAMLLLANVGGASGPLYGTLFMRMAKVAKEHEQLDIETLIEMMKQGIEGIQARGQATIQDKTMLDVLIPVSECLQSSYTQNGVIDVDQVVQCAEAAMQATAPLQAKKGRASYLNERSIGVIDPGAASSYFLIKSVCEVLKENR